MAAAPALAVNTVSQSAGAAAAALVKSIVRAIMCKWIADGKSQLESKYVVIALSCSPRRERERGGESERERELLPINARSANYF